MKTKLKNFAGQWAQVPGFLLCALFGAAFLALACQMKIPSWESIQDSKLLDRRIVETPREQTIRRCKQEGERFRVGCTLCHTAAPEGAITAAKPHLTEIGSRARIMRNNPSFGLNRACQECHLSKFRLNGEAREKYGAGGAFSISPKTD
jgi:hypothetical protein